MSSSKNKKGQRGLLPFLQGKKGMETWVLVFWIIALVLLVLLISWYAGLGKQADQLLENILGWFS